MDKLSMLSKVIQAEDQLSCKLAGEEAVLNVKTGLYYCLDPVGARIWQLIREPKSLQEIRDILVTEYEVESARCETDLLAILQKLQTKGLIETTD